MALSPTATVKLGYPSMRVVVTPQVDKVVAWKGGHAVVMMRLRKRFALRCPDYGSGQAVGLVHEFHGSFSGRLLTNTYLAKETLLNIWDLSSYSGTHHPVEPGCPMSVELGASGQVFE